MRSFESLPFTHTFTDSLPGDASRAPGPRRVREAAYSFVDPMPVREPRIVGWSERLAEEFGLERPPVTGTVAELLTGNQVLAGWKPYAARYGGHQFGNWAGQLGDGRAITLAEAPDRHGASHEFQLKGAGLTPYSRRADGRAVLRSSIREFVCSEAMHALGVPTTRALSVCTTGEAVVRDMFYDGNAAAEPGAVVCRVAPSFVRFGSFEIYAAENEPELQRRLADYVIDHFFPEIQGQGTERYLAWFAEVCQRTARLMAEWLRVGFVHGVMNTDNLSILGLTIDYGPYGWLESYDPLWTPNTTDLPGRRYAFGRQAPIAHWNLAQLARALYGLCGEDTAGLQTALDGYVHTYEAAFLGTMAAKLGVVALEGADDRTLLEEMEALLRAEETDMTLFYRGLARIEEGEAESGLPGWLRAAFYSEQVSEESARRWRDWLSRYRGRVAREASPAAERARKMNRVNPLYVPRNYLLQEAIEEAAQGSSARVETLLKVLGDPYTEQAGREAFAAKRPEWARHRPGCSTLSCSS